jgi:hypothetical protein
MRFCAHLLRNSKFAGTKKFQTKDAEEIQANSEPALSSKCALPALNLQKCKRQGNVTQYSTTSLSSRASTPLLPLYLQQLIALNKVSSQKKLTSATREFMLDITLRKVTNMFHFRTQGLKYHLLLQTSLIQLHHSQPQEFSAQFPTQLLQY